MVAAPGALETVKVDRVYRQRRRLPRTLRTLVDAERKSHQQITRHLANASPRALFGNTTKKRCCSSGAAANSFVIIDTVSGVSPFVPYRRIALNPFVFTSSEWLGRSVGSKVQPRVKCQQLSGFVSTADACLGKIAIKKALQSPLSVWCAHTHTYSRTTTTVARRKCHHRLRVWKSKQAVGNGRRRRAGW